MKKLLFFCLSISQICMGAPLKLEAEGTYGERIELLKCEETLGMYCFRASGFAPGEKILFVSKSVDEVIYEELEMPQNGQLILMHQPAVIGYTEGDSTITLVGENKNSVELTYHWKLQ
ncbi:MAG: hypothetical protein P0S96_06385 [Simkaniaceae bacterium]|nr:hypothetical protein [Candidatus Sacchlamyda saccharinae]